MSVAHPIGLKARTAVPPQEPAAAADERVLDRSIGDFIRQARGLSEAQVEQILGHQRLHGIRFGEAAVALQLATRDDVLWALSQQFHYPYAPGDGASFNSELIAAVDPFHRQTESFRDIRSQLMLGALAPEQPRRALAVMSPNIGDGKSFFAANLAVVFSQLDAEQSPQIA